MKSTAAIPTAILGSGNSEVEPVIASTSSSPILVSAKNCEALCRREVSIRLIDRAEHEVTREGDAPGRNADTSVLTRHSKINSDKIMIVMYTRSASRDVVQVASFLNATDPDPGFVSVRSCL